LFKAFVRPYKLPPGASPATALRRLSIFSGATPYSSSLDSEIE
jgi:hypothetical protein